MLGDVMERAWSSQCAMYPECARSIRAFGNADMADTLLSMRETRTVLGAVQAAAIEKRLCAWYPEYAAAEAEMIARRHGHAAARRADRREAARVERFVVACCDALHLVISGREQSSALTNLRASLGLTRRRFDGVVTALRMIGAVRVVGDRVVALAGVEHARQWLLDRRALVMDASDDRAEPWAHLVG